MSLLALFALALQLGMSFGHIHAHPAPDPAISAQASAVTSSAPGLDHDHHGLDICAICVTIAMAHSLIDAALPVLSIPAQFHIARHASLPPSDAPDSPRAAFQSRAPPTT